MLMAGQGSAFRLFVFGGPSLPGHLGGNDISIQKCSRRSALKASGKSRASSSGSNDTCPGAGSCAGCSPRRRWRRSPARARCPERGRTGDLGRQGAFRGSRRRRRQLLEQEIDTRKIITRAALRTPPRWAWRSAARQYCPAPACDRARGRRGLRARRYRGGEPAHASADVRPAGRFLMSDLHRAGGIPW